MKNIVMILLLTWSIEALAKTKQELIHLIKQDCGSCHGLSLRGGLGLPITTEALKDKDNSALFYIIKEGKPGTAMPPWKPILTDDEIRQIVQYLKEGLS